MEVRYTSISEAYEIAVKNKVASVTCEPKFVEIISDCFNVNSLSVIVFSNGIPLIGIIVYYRNKSIVHPTTYVYTSFWKTSDSSILLEDALIACIKQLQKKFRSIELLLPPSISDIRSFIYCGFKSDVKYTYINNLSNIKLSSDVKSMRNRALDLGIDFKFGEDSADILSQNISSFLELNYNKAYIQTLKNFIIKLKSVGYLTSISARLDKSLLASGYILLDKANQNAMNLFITSNKSHYRTGVHSSLYLYNLYSLKEQGFLTNDLFGASTKGIGNFKAKFNGSLTPFFYVKYNYLRWVMVRTVKKARSLLVIFNSLK